MQANDAGDHLFVKVAAHGVLKHRLKFVEGIGLGVDGVSQGATLARLQSLHCGGNCGYLVYMLHHFGASRYNPIQVAN